MIVKTDAVVLRSMKFRETSKILTLYTQEFGKLSAIAKGCRGPKNRFGSALEPMNYVTAVLYKRDERELQLLTQCDLVKPFRHLCEQMEKMYAGMSLIALLERVTRPEERNERLFATVVSCLEAINDATQSPVKVLYMFEVRLLGFLGFEPNFRTCAVCRRAVDGNAPAGLNIAVCGVLCARCSSARGGDGIISGEGLQLLRSAQEAHDAGDLIQLPIGPGARNEVRDALRRYLQGHVEGLQDLKTEEVFAALL